MAFQKCPQIGARVLGFVPTCSLGITCGLSLRKAGNLGQGSFLWARVTPEEALSHAADNPASSWGGGWKNLDATNSICHVLVAGTSLPIPSCEQLASEILKGMAHLGGEMIT